MAADKIPPENHIQTSQAQAKGPQSETFRRRYADFFEFAPVGYFTFDPSGVILDVNSTGAMLLGADRKKLLGQPFSALISANSQSVFDSHSRRLFETREQQTCDVKLLDGCGQLHWVQIESVATAAAIRRNFARSSMRLRSASSARMRCVRRALNWSNGCANAPPNLKK